VVDYLGLADQLKKALVSYTESGVQGNHETIIRPRPGCESVCAGTRMPHFETHAVC
jgi:hypothetical protein